MARSPGSASPQLGIFISYRRADTQAWAGRLRECLARAFGVEPLFLDTASIAPGDDFAEAISAAVAHANVLLALIGPRWLDPLSPGGPSRLTDPADFVRLEIGTALRRKLRVIPVLLGGAAMPAAKALPKLLKALEQKQAIELSDTRWDYDCGQLVRAIANATGVEPAESLSAAGGSSTVVVGEGAELAHVEVHDVVGIRREGATEPHAGEQHVEVLKRAKLENVRVHDIVGVEEKTKR